MLERGQTLYYVQIKSPDNTNPGGEWVWGHQFLLCSSSCFSMGHDILNIAVIFVTRTKSFWVVWRTVCCGYASHSTSVIPYCGNPWKWRRCCCFTLPSYLQNDIVQRTQVFNLSTGLWLYKDKPNRLDTNWMYPSNPTWPAFTFKHLVLFTLFFVLW